MPFRGRGGVEELARSGSCPFAFRFYEYKRSNRAKLNTLISLNLFSEPHHVRWISTAPDGVYDASGCRRA
jgi:hypothetical protein